MRASSWVTGGHDQLGRLLDLGREVLHGLGHHREARAGLARALGLDRGVERDQARLQRDLRDVGAAPATSRSEVTTPSTPSPTWATASRAWPIATRLAPPLASIARLDCTIACMSAASWPISATWRVLAATTSSITPSSSAAPRPSSDACVAMLRIAPA